MNETKSMYARFYDEESSMHWSSDPEINRLFIRTIENYLNDRLRSRGYLFLNEVYNELGLSWTKAGQVVGWLWPSDNPEGVSFGDYVEGEGASILLDFNVEGVIFDKIEKES